MTDREHTELVRQRQFYAEQAATFQALADSLDSWCQKLASALFLTLVDSPENGAAASSTLRDYREWIIEREARR